ncbi:hypothetical protein J4Q44_G00307270, partial [Coregonus suidteri]
KRTETADLSLSLSLSLSPSLALSLPPSLPLSLPRSLPPCPSFTASSLPLPFLVSPSSLLPYSLLNPNPGADLDVKTLEDTHSLAYLHLFPSLPWRIKAHCCV